MKQELFERGYPHDANAEASVLAGLICVHRGRQPFDRVTERDFVDYDYSAVYQCVKWCWTHLERVGTREIVKAIYRRLSKRILLDIYSKSDPLYRMEHNLARLKAARLARQNILNIETLLQEQWLSWDEALPIRT